MNKIKEIIKLIYFITKFRNDYVIYEYVKKIYYDFDNSISLFTTALSINLLDNKK